MDALQAKEENDPVKKADEAKKIAKQTMASGSVSSSSSTFYNPLQQQQKPVKKVQQPPQQQSFLSNMSMSMASMTPITSNVTGNNKSTAKTNSVARTIPGGSTTKNLFPSSPPAKTSLATSLATPKGKLVLPAKSKSGVSPKLASKKAIGTPNNTSKANIAASNKSTPGGGSKLKINAPLSSAKTNANARNKKGTSGGGLVVGGANKPQSSKPMTAVSPKPGSAEQTASKVSMPKPVSTPQAPSIEKPPNNLSKTPKPTKEQEEEPSPTPASDSATESQSTEAKSMLPTMTKQQEPKKEQQNPSTDTQATTSVAPTTDVTLSQKTPEVPSTSPTLATIAEPKSTTETPAVTKGEKESSSGTASVPEEDKPEHDTREESSAQDASTSDAARLSLQQQQEEFQKQLDGQRQEMEGRMQQLQEQFSEQLQRLEAHHRQETEVTNAQFETSLAHWEQEVQDRENLLASQTQTFDSNQQKAQKKIEKLSSQLNQARELLGDKEKEDRRLQEKHLQQLRDMEKQCFKKEDTSNSLEQDIQKLQVRTRIE